MGINNNSSIRSFARDRLRTRTRIILVLLITPTLFAVTTTADPNNPEVQNTVCTTWNNGTSICDDYDFAHDMTPSQEWVRGKYLFEMHNTTMLTLTLEWEVHEFNRSLIGLQDLDLGGQFDLNESGAPADYIRNYLGHTTPQGMLVREQLLDEFSDAVQSVVEESFGGSASVSSDLVDQVTIDGIQIQCTDDMNQDSVDEVWGLSNNAFQPPLCLRSMATVTVADELVGFGNDTAVDIERAYQGVLTMGGSVESNFSIFSRAGHSSYFEVIAPAYASIDEVGGGGTTVTRQQGPWTYEVGVWMIDNLGAGDGGETAFSNVSMTVVRRDTSTSAVNIDVNSDIGVKVETTLDMRDPNRNLVTTTAAIHYLPESTLQTWGVDFADENVEIPWVTSDGIRMAYEFGLIDLDSFTSAIPLDSINQGANDFVGVDLEMGEFQWFSANSTGGLNFTHTPGQTCSEPLPVTHCIQGGNAMDGTYPIYLSSSSKPFAADAIEMVTDLISESYDMPNLTAPNPEDLAAVLSVLEFEVVIDTAFLTQYLPEELPPSEVTVNIILPDWVTTEGGASNTITLHARSDGGAFERVDFTGPNPYHERWDDPICERSAGCTDASDDLICRSDWRTCIAVKASLDLSELNVMEWSQSVTLTVQGQIEVELYRIAVPQPMTDEYGITIESMPADLIRHAVAVSEESENGLMSMFGQPPLKVDLGGQMHTLEISNRGLQEFADSLAAMVNEEIQSLETNSESATIDLSGLSVSAQIEMISRPYENYLDDDDPLRIILTLRQTEILARYDSGSVFVDTNVATSAMTSLLGGMVNVFDGRAAETSGLVTMPEEPVEFDVAPVVETRDVDYGFDSDGDGSMNNDADLDIRPSIKIDVTLPKGLLIEMSSSLGRDEQIERQDGRQNIIYRVPLCDAQNPSECDLQNDHVEIQFTVGYAFIVQQIAPYLFGGLGLVLLLILFRLRKRKRKQNLLEEQRKAVMVRRSSTREVERELLGISPGVGGGGPDDWFAGLDLEEFDNQNDGWM